MAEGDKQAWITKLIESIPALLIVLGVGMLILGFAEGIKYNQWLPITDPLGRAGAFVTGAILLGLGVYSWTATKSPSLTPSAYGIKINHPKSGDRIVDVVDVRGTIKKPVPEGFTLRVFRIYPDSDAFVPVGGKARVDMQSGTWEADRCSVGGKTGDKRAIAVYLVGASGSALIEYHTEAARVHRRTIDRLFDATKIEGEFLPPVGLRTQDMFECDRVPVWRA